ncbi:hypothetical protein AAMO2058_001750300, partial [Amorphochlora amoebiformis]
MILPQWRRRAISTLALFVCWSLLAGRTSSRNNGPLRRALVPMLDKSGPVYVRQWGPVRREGGAGDDSEVLRLCQTLEAAVNSQISASVSNEERAEASRFCDSLLSHPLGWRVAIGSLRVTIGSSQTPALQLWGLEALRIWVRKAIDNANATSPKIPPAVGTIQPPELPREAAMAWKEETLGILSSSDGLRGVDPPIRNKYALLIGLMVKWLFPYHWPSAFEQILSIGMSGSVSSADFTLRVLDAIDELGVDRQMPRSVTDRAVSTQLKDEIRLRAVANIVSFCKHVLSTGGSPGDPPETASSPGGLQSGQNPRGSPDVREFALRMMAKYVDWTDITQYTDDQTLNLLQSLANASPSLRAGVAGLYSAMLHKITPETLENSKLPKNVDLGCIRAGSRLVSEIFGAALDIEKQSQTPLSELPATSEASISTCVLTAKISLFLLEFFGENSGGFRDHPSIAYLLKSILTLLAAAKESPSLGGRLQQEIPGLKKRAIRYIASLVAYPNGEPLHE